MSPKRNDQGMMDVYFSFIDVRMIQWIMLDQITIAWMDTPFKHFSFFDTSYVIVTNKSFFHLHSRFSILCHSVFSYT